MKKSLLFYVLLLSTLLPAFGSHLVGVDVRAQYVSGNIYDIYVTQYIDCQGILSAPSVSFTGISGCSGPAVNPTIVGGWNLETNEEITNICSGTLTTCSGGAAPGFRKVVHLAQYDFTGVSCTKYQVAFNHCCRNGAINNLSNPNLTDVTNWAATVDLTLNGNSSPDFIFDNPAVFYTNTSNLSFNLNMAASDPDLDSLTYELVPVTGTGGNAVAYNLGYSGTNPLGPGWTVGISPTGLVACTYSGTPLLGSYAIGVKVKEYRNGTVIGEIMREFPVMIVSATIPVCNYCQAGFAVQGIFQNCTSGLYEVSIQDYSIAASGTGTPSYLIDYGDGSAFSSSFNHSYVNQGAYPITMYYDNGNGCQDTATTFVSLNTPNVGNAQANFFMNSTSICQGNSVGFTDNSNNCPSNPIVSWIWSFGDGNTSMQQNPVHVYNVPGNYTVELVVHHQDGSMSSSYGTLSVNSTPISTISLTPSGPYTVGDTITASASPSGGTAPYAYNWSLSSNLTNLTGPFGSPIDIEITGPGNSGIIHCVTDANGCSSCDTLTFIPQSPPPPSCTIIGSVYLATNPPTYVLADSFDVYLIQYDGTSQLLTAIDTFYSLANPAGGYSFYNVPAGSYRLKSALKPSSVYYFNYLPSYYVANFQSALYWNQADSLIILNPCTGPYTADIVLPLGNNPGGPGFIGGYVYQGANKMTDTALVDIEVILLNQQMEPVAYDYTDANGYFSFSALAYGTYYLYVEMLNTSCTPLEVTISGIQPSVETEFNVVEQNITGVMTAIDDLPEYLASIGLFPNPNAGICTLSLHLNQPETITVTISDITGRTVIQEIKKMFEGENEWTLKTETLPQGIYTVSVSGGNQEGVRLKMIKE